jgi:hypothetical protein
MIESATRLLGTTPRYCLSIFAAVGHATGSISAEKDDSETAQLVQRIVNAFAGRWPAVFMTMYLLDSKAHPRPDHRRGSSGTGRAQPGLPQPTASWSSTRTPGTAGVQAACPRRGSR